MSGHYYVVQINPAVFANGGDDVRLLAGPFSTWQEAEQAGATAVPPQRAKHPMAGMIYDIVFIQSNRVLMSIADKRASPVDTRIPGW